MGGRAPKLVSSARSASGAMGGQSLATERERETNCRKREPKDAVLHGARTCAKPDPKPPQNHVQTRRGKVIMRRGKVITRGGKVIMLGGKVIMERLGHTFVFVRC